MFSRSARAHWFALALATLAASGALAIVRAPAAAIPIFAQRYALKCSTCHTALPELNDFGNKFRDNGYRLPASVPRHGTTVAAIRYNLEWEQEPAPGTRRLAPAASIVADQDFGAINAYLHYNLGAAGAPGAPYLGFLATYDEHTRSLYRAGLFELPLTQSPGQRLDDISGYGYLPTAVGQNDLALSAPRLGFEAERHVGEARLAATIAFGEFKGAAYGGKPVFTGAETVAGLPEIGLYGRVPFFAGLFQLNAEALEGERSIHLPGRDPFDDPYERFGFGIHTSFFHKRLDLEGQQWLGRDNNADGSGGAINSSGGYARLKYFLTPHFYAAARYDAAANPFPTRTLVLYAGALVAGRARLVIEHRQSLLGGTPTLGGYLTVGFPWPLGL